MEHLLPVGTIVKARWTEKNALRMMIVGYYPRDKKTGTVYDYLATFYPMGMSFSNALQGVNHGAILGIEAMGFEDESTRAYLDGMAQMVDAAKQKVLESGSFPKTEERKSTMKEDDKDPLDEWFV